MSYSSEGDLILGDLQIPAAVSKQDFIDSAAEEIDSKIGFLYVLPIPFNDLPLHQQLLLKQINNKLASGRLILTLDIAGEETSLHAYGLRLITEAMNELMCIANGDVDLTAPRTNPYDSSTDNNKAAAIVNHDAESAVDMFENSFMRGEPSYWNPGSPTVTANPPLDYRGR